MPPCPARVTAIEEREVPGGAKVLSVVIRNDFKDARAEAKGAEDYMSLSAAEVAAMVREAGGGASSAWAARPSPPTPRSPPTRARRRPC